MVEAEVFYYHNNLGNCREVFATALPRVTAGGWAPFVRRTFLSGYYHNKRWCKRKRYTTPEYNTIYDMAHVMFYLDYKSHHLVSFLRSPFLRVSLETGPWRWFYPSLLPIPRRWPQVHSYSQKLRQRLRQSVRGWPLPGFIFYFSRWNYRKVQIKYCKRRNFRNEFKPGPLEAISVIFSRRALIFLFESSWTKWKMTPLLCAFAVVITLETQKCQKGAPCSVEFNFFIKCNRQKRFPQNERRRADLQNPASDFQFLPGDL